MWRRWAFPVPCCRRAAVAADAFRRSPAPRRTADAVARRCSGSSPRGPGLGGRRHPPDAEPRRVVRAHAVARTTTSTPFRPARGRRHRRRSVAGQCSRWAATRTAETVARAGAAARTCPRRALGEAAAAAPRVQTLSASARSPRPLAGLLVADLTSMWAGPLCGQLLARAGAIVVKVESPSRPDGTRGGDPGVLRLDERRKALLCSRFRPPSGAAGGTAGRRRRGARVLAARGADPPRPRPGRRCPPAADGCGCGSPATAPTRDRPTGSRSATTPRSRVAWSDTTARDRCSSVTRSPTR